MASPSGSPCNHNGGSDQEEEEEEDAACLQQEASASDDGGSACNHCPRQPKRGDGTSRQLTKPPSSHMETCFRAFDKDGDEGLSLNEFGRLCRALFRDPKGNAYHMEEHKLRAIMSVFDTNKDGVIDLDEFAFCWHKWIKKIVRPVCAIIVVDVQNDFISGSLNVSLCPAAHRGEDVLEPINRLLATVQFERVVYSLDWHPSDHVSFVDNVFIRKMHPTSKVKPEDAQVYDVVVFEGPYVGEGKNRKCLTTEQKLWPRHCVQGSWGSELHADLDVVEGALLVRKGTNPDVDSYSAFFDNNKLSSTVLFSELQSKNITDLFVCGIAFDFCVGATATHACELGFRTILVDDGCRGVAPDTIQEVTDTLHSKHAVIVHSSQVNDMVHGRDRRPELGYKAAMDLLQQMTQKGSTN